MKPGQTRRAVLGGVLATVGAGFTRNVLAGAEPAGTAPDLTPFVTPYKYGKLVLAKSGVSGSFDERSVDCPFVFTANGHFYMTYVGFDGIGYQTGLAVSKDLINWQRDGLILARDASDPIIRYNIALMCILRDDALESAGRLQKVGGRYLGAWHAYLGFGLPDPRCLYHLPVPEPGMMRV